MKLECTRGVLAAHTVFTTTMSLPLQVEGRLAASSDPEVCARLAANLGDLAQALPRLRAALQ